MARVPEHEPQTGLGELLDRARTLVDTLEAWHDDRARSSRGRLKDSVVRPLGTLVEVSEDQASTDDDRPGRGQERAGRPAEEIWELARLATIERVRSPEIAELAEAVAALQDLAITLTDDDSEAAARVAELNALQAELPCRIQCQANGPYLVTNVEYLTNWLGERLPTRPQIALCRCGQSAIKPFCDGTHAEIGFTDAKDPSACPTGATPTSASRSRSSITGGSASTRATAPTGLPPSFTWARSRSSPRAAGRMDEIIRAVRDCPSGALSYAIDEVEARDEVDYHGKREPAIEVSRDGPYRVTGGITLTDSHGHDEPRNQGASREHYALCRCGHSQNKPFCSGMHWYVDFKDPVPDPDHEPTIFEWCGGLPALTKMTRLFYEKYVPQDPLLAPLVREHVRRPPPAGGEMASRGLLRP